MRRRVCILKSGLLLQHPSLSYAVHSSWNRFFQLFAISNYLPWKFPNLRHFYLSVSRHFCSELMDALAARKNFSEKIASNYFRQMCQAIAWCHSKLVVHRDLKVRSHCVLLCCVAHHRTLFHNLMCSFFHFSLKTSY